LPAPGCVADREEGCRDTVLIEDRQRGRLEIRVPVVERDRDRLAGDRPSSRHPRGHGRKRDEPVPARGERTQLAVERGRSDGRLDWRIADGMVREYRDLLETDQGVEEVPGGVARRERSRPKQVVGGGLPCTMRRFVVEQLTLGQMTVT